MKRVFNHEKLQVYQDSIQFVAWTSELLERVYNARGAALHCSAVLDILSANEKLEITEASAGKQALHDIVSMLVGLIKSNPSDRLHETTVQYRIKTSRNK